MAVDVQYGNHILRIISTYLPHAGYPWEEFEREMEKITLLSMEAKDQGKYVVIAGDFNLSLNIGERRNSMKNLCDEFQLTITNGNGQSYEEHN